MFIEIGDWVSRDRHLKFEVNSLKFIISSSLIKEGDTVVVHSPKIYVLKKVGTSELDRKLWLI